MTKNSIINPKEDPLLNTVIVKLKLMDDNEKFKIISIFAIILIISLKYLSIHIIISICFSLIIVYILIEKNYEPLSLKNTAIDSIFNELDIFDKYTYLSLDIDIIELYYNNMYLMKLNKTEFESSLSNLNSFYKIYSIVMSRKGKKLEMRNIENAVIYQNRCLNCIHSILHNTRSYSGELYGKKINNPVILKINNMINKVQQVTDSKINEMMERNSKKNDIKDINNNTRFYYHNDPSPYTQDRNIYSENYNQYNII